MTETGKVDARGSQGVRIESNNTQVNYLCAPASVAVVPSQAVTGTISRAAANFQPHAALMDDSPR